MRAVVCKEFGPPEKLVVEELPDPKPGTGEVLIRVVAAPITFPETLVIEDKYQFRQELPFIPGGEVSGEVLELGDGVEDFRVGDLVAGGGGAGGFAEKAVIPSSDLRPIPDGVTPEQVVGLMYGAGTCYYGLKDRGELKSGETLLVLGASGHLGIAAIEIGKILGARVIAAASTEEKLALCRDAGADETINYATEDLKARTKELTGGQGVNVVFDGVGGEYAEPALRAIAWRGRYLVIGFPAGIPKIPLNLALLKSCQIVGVFLGAAFRVEREHMLGMRDEVERLVASGKLDVPVSRRYGLDEVPQALRDLLDRKVVGKIVCLP